MPNATTELHRKLKDAGLPPSIQKVVDRHCSFYLVLSTHREPIGAKIQIVRVNMAGRLELIFPAKFFGECDSIGYFEDGGWRTETLRLPVKQLTLL